MSTCKRPVNKRSRILTRRIGMAPYLSLIQTCINKLYYKMSFQNTEPIVLRTIMRYLSIDVDNIPTLLEQSNVVVAQQCVLVGRIEQSEVLHNDGHLAQHDKLRDVFNY